MIRRSALQAALATALFATGAAQAAPATIVALGASNTEGKKLSQFEAYPAQLERILRARGLDVTVVNAGVSGDTTAGMLARVDSSVPAGTQLVILQPGSNGGGGGRSRRGGGHVVDPSENLANLEALVARLEARGVAVASFAGFAGAAREVARHHHIVFLGRFRDGVPDGAVQSDGQHLTAEGYGIVAQRIAPRIAALLSRGAR